MSLLGIGIAAAGLYGLNMVWTEMSAESAKKKLHDIEIEEDHVDVVKHFDLIIAMLDIKTYNGILPEDGYKECQDLLMYELMNVTKKDLKRFEKHYKKIRKQQIKNHKEQLKEYHKEANDFIKRYIMPSGKIRRFDRINSYESVRDTTERCNKLYNETPWKKLAKRPAKVIKTPDGKSKEMWQIKRIVHPNDAYRKCNKAIGHEVY